MKFRKKLFEGIIFISYSLFMLIIFVFFTIIFPEKIMIILSIILFLIHLLTYLFLIPTVEITKEGIIFYQLSKNKTMYKWNEIRYYQDSYSSKMSIILITLKDDSQISLDNRKKIKQEIKKYCGDIPDITDIAKEDRCERYTNYAGKFIDLTECEFEVVNSNTECCVFCNERTHKISDNCYCAVKKSRKFYVCPKCYNDFKSFLRFKIKK